MWPSIALPLQRQQADTHPEICSSCLLNWPVPRQPWSRSHGAPTQGWVLLSSVLQVRKLKHKKVKRIIPGLVFPWYCHSWSLGLVRAGSLPGWLWCCAVPFVQHVFRVSQYILWQSLVMFAQWVDKTINSKAKVLKHSSSSQLLGSRALSSVHPGRRSNHY